MPKYKNGYYILIILFCSIILFFSSCGKSGQESNYNDVRVIHVNYFADDRGLVYDDHKIKLLKCYFDFESMTNIYFCTKPNCDHTALECNSRLCHPYTFFIGKDHYYFESKFEMIDKKVTMFSCLYKSDLSNTETKLVAKLDCYIFTDIYLVNNTLYIVAPKPKYVDGIATSSERWDLYKINMKNYSVKKIEVNGNEGVDSYLPYGIMGNNMILYRRYYDKVIKPEEYGLQGNILDYLKDEENYKRYMEDVMNVFHEEMLLLNLETGEQTPLDLPVPLLVYRDCFYYNREKADGSHELVSYNLITREERVIYEGPVSKCNAIGNCLFFSEGIVTISRTTFQPIIDTKENGKEYCYDMIIGELKEVSSRLPEKVEMKLVKEYGDYYIFLYSDYYGNVGQRVGYILKEDYFNDKSKFTLVAPE